MMMMMTVASFRHDVFISCRYYFPDPARNTKFYSLDVDRETVGARFFFIEG